MCESPFVFLTIFPAAMAGFLFVLKHSKIKQLQLMMITHANA
jgi:hypothetical protein